MLNDVLVFNLPGIVGLPVHSRWSRSLQYARASVCRSRNFGRCFLFPRIFFSVKRPVLPFFQFVSKNSIGIFREPYSSNWCFNALSSALNSTFFYRYFVSVIRIIIYSNIVCFCLQALEMYLKLNIV